MRKLIDRYLSWRYCRESFLLQRINKLIKETKADVGYLTTIVIHTADFHRARTCMFLADRADTALFQLQELKQRLGEWYRSGQTGETVYFDIVDELSNIEAELANVQKVYSQN